MAIVNNGTKVSIKVVPAGYVFPVVTDFTDPTHQSNYTLDVLKATVENADPKITLANIIGDVGIGIKKQIDDLLANDFVNTNTVEAYAVITKVSNNVIADTEADFWLNNALKYVVDVTLFVKVS